MYTETSKSQEGSLRKTSLQKCFEVTNVDKFDREEAEKDKALQLRSHGQ